MGNILVEATVVGGDPGRIVEIVTLELTRATKHAETMHAGTVASALAACVI